MALAAMVSGGILSSCNSDYLDVKPITDFDESALADPSVCATLVDGIYEAMNVQYTQLEVNQNVGEANINMNCGEGAGQDLCSGLWTALPGLRTWSYINNPSSYMAIMPWMYYYNLINLSNYVIKAVPATSENHEGVDLKLLGYKAQALTVRAHAYTRLLGYYGQRWEDSDNGEAYCIVIRTVPGTESTPLRKMNEVLALIYSDCEEAEKLYDLSGYSRDNERLFAVNKSVAQGVWARAALIKHDWQTAADKANAARQGYTIMSENDLFAGFYTNNTETMWSMNPIETTTYYWSWGSHYACNGTYVNNWQIGAGAINYDLYREAKTISDKDLRLKFFWTPDKLAEVPRTFNQGRMKESDFWNPDIVDASNILNMAHTHTYDKRDPLGFGMTNCLAWWLDNYHYNVYTGGESRIANDDNQFNSYILRYTEGKKSENPRLPNKDGESRWATLLATPFGAQNKFWAEAPYGNMAMPWMRASEMALTEAEAQYHLNNPTAALAALNEVQTKRIPGYTSSASGENLLNEIKVCRRIELWGEGFSFLDLKRWNEPRIRRIWIENDPNSGNCDPAEQAGMSEADIQNSQSTKYCNGWRFAIPAREYNYNDSIKIGLLKTIE